LVLTGTQLVVQEARKDSQVLVTVAS